MRLHPADRPTAKDAFTVIRSALREPTDGTRSARVPHLKTRSFASSSSSYDLNRVIGESDIAGVSGIERLDSVGVYSDAEVV